jgi:hypothetical protein
MRSQRTLDLLEKRVVEIEKGARQRPDWPERRDEMQKAIRKSTLADYRRYIDEIVDRMALAEEGGDLHTVAECVKELAGKTRSFSITQPRIDANGEPIVDDVVLAAKWAYFVEGNSRRRTRRRCGRRC